MLIGGDEPRGGVRASDVLEVHDEAWRHIVDGLTATDSPSDLIRAVIDPEGLSDRQVRHLVTRLLVHAVTAARGLRGAADTLDMLGEAVEQTIDGPPLPFVPLPDDYDRRARVLACALVLDIWMDAEARRRADDGGT